MKTNIILVLVGEFGLRNLCTGEGALLLVQLSINFKLSSWKIKKIKGGFLKITYKKAD